MLAKPEHLLRRRRVGNGLFLYFSANSHCATFHGVALPILPRWCRFGTRLGGYKMETEFRPCTHRHSTDTAFRLPHLQVSKSSDSLMRENVPAQTHQSSEILVKRVPPPNRCTMRASRDAAHNAYTTQWCAPMLDGKLQSRSGLALEGLLMSHDEITKLPHKLELFEDLMYAPCAPLHVEAEKAEMSCRTGLEKQQSVSGPNARYNLYPCEALSLAFYSQ